MQIYRPDYLKTPRQGSVSIPLSSAARSCVVPSPLPSAGDQQHPVGGHEEGIVALTESDRTSERCTAGQLPNADSARLTVAPFGQAVSRISSRYAPWVAAVFMAQPRRAAGRCAGHA